MFSFKSVSGRIFWIISLIFLASFTFILVLQFVSINEISNKGARSTRIDLVESNINLLEESINLRINRLKELPKAFPEFDTATNQEINTVMSQMCKYDPDSESGDYFFANEDGIIQSEGNPDISVADKEYFRKAKSTRKTFVSDFKTSENDPTLWNSTFAVPFIDSNNTFRGVFVNVAKVNEWVTYLANTHYGKTGYAFVLNGDGAFLYHPRPDFVPELLEDVLVPSLAKVFRDNVVRKEVGELAYFFSGVNKHLYFMQVPYTNWVLGVTIDDPEINADGSRWVWISSITILVLFAVVIFSLIILLKNLRKKLYSLSNLIKEYGTGNLAVDFDIFTGTNEIAQMSHALRDMSLSLNTAVSSIVQSSHNLKSSSEELAGISQEQLHDASLVSEQSEEVKTHVINTSTSIEEVTSGVEEVAASAQNVSKLAQDLQNEAESTSGLAQKGLELIQNSNKNIVETQEQTKSTSVIANELSQQAQNVGGILNSISAIAEQTNLLALNAAIEAARAGEAGKGFAVVADEIRKLAEESKNATTNISDILKLISKGVDDANIATQETVSLAKKVGEDSQEINIQFEEISSNVKKMATMVDELTEQAEQQSAASEEMASAMDASAQSITQVSEQVEQMADSIANQTTTAKKINDYSVKMQNLSKTLEDFANKFKLQENK